MNEKSMEELLPFYVNGTLSPAEREAVEAWLAETPAAAEALADQQRLQAVLQAQPEQLPSPAVLEKARARRAQAGPPVAARPTWTAWAFGVVLALAVLLLSWAVLRPGIVLEWSVDSQSLEKFRVYRAEKPDAAFDLLEEVAVSPSTGRYTFVDNVIFPAQPYEYQVEVVGTAGSAYSEIVTGDSLAALLTQLAVLLASLVIGYIGVLLFQGGVPSSLGKKYEYG